MDLLQRELERKKSVLAKAHGESHHDKKRKYWKQSELRRLEEEEQAKAEEQEEQRKKEEREQEAAAKRFKETTSTDTTNQHDKKKQRGSRSTTLLSDRNESTKPHTTTKTQRNHESVSSTSSLGSDVDATATTSRDAANTAATASSLISPQQVTHQLRAFGLPIRFFGETLEQRIERLQVALQTQHQTLQGLSEMEEYRLGHGHGIRNPFLERSSRHEDTTGTASKEKKMESKQESSHGNNTSKDEGQKDHPQHPESGDEADNDPAKRVYKFLKGLLKEWEADLEARPSIVANSVAGRNESKTLKQCKDYIRPLFKQLKRRKLEAGMQAHLTKIVEFAQQGEFVKAHDAYMDVAIGRAAWPIGVTMVGIHARSGRAKIESANVAHVMNSELQRKYLTSVKRLLSYAQKKRPDVDPSKKVL